MSMLQELHEAHLARRRRLGALSPIRKPEPAPSVPEIPPKIIAPVWSAPRLVEITPKPAPKPAGCILDLMMGGGDQAPALHGPTMHSILEEVAAKYNVTLHMIRCKQRTKWIAEIRQEFYYRCAAETTKSYPEIARFAGGRDHSTIMYGISAHCSKNNLPQPRNPRENIFDTKQRKHRESYQRVKAEFRAQDEARA